MAQFSWSSSQPSTGAAKNSKVSKEVVRGSYAQCIFLPHVVEEPLAMHGGQSSTIMRSSQLTERTVASISETDRMPEGTNSITAKLITVGEHGFSVPYTDYAASLATYDLPNELKMLLQDDLTKYLDNFIANEFKRSLYIYTPTGAASASTATNGTAPAAAGSAMNVYHIERLRSILHTTLKAKPVDGSNYVGIFHDDSCLAIRRDPSWEIWHQNVTPENKFNGETGTIENIRILSSNHGGTAVGSDGLNGGTTLGEGVVFGDNAVKFVKVMAPQVVYAKGEDYDRLQAVGWRAIMGIGCTWAADVANAGECNVVFVTASTL